MNIGQAAAASGLRAKTIRYYEEIGLVEPAKRGKGGYREYDPADIAMLRFVARARDLGFSLAETSSLLSLYKDKERSSSAVLDLTLDPSVRFSTTSRADNLRPRADSALRGMAAVLMRERVSEATDDRPAVDGASSGRLVRLRT